MPTPNYSYEKRQRELAKKRKAEEKRQRKAGRADSPAPADTTADTPAGPLPPPAGNDPVR